MKLSYEVRRSAKRKRLSISVERDRRVVVHAPEQISDAKIQQIVEAKKAWIYEKTKHPQKYEDQPHAPGKELVNGESVLYLGRYYKIQLADAEAVSFDQCFIVPRTYTSTKKQALREWFIARAKEKILPLVEQCAKSLGVHYEKAKIVDNRYRWASCTPLNNVNFNWRLIKAPMYVIDYIIVHELAHLLENNHTPRFWNIVRTKANCAEKAKTWLKQNGQILEEDI